MIERIDMLLRSDAISVRYEKGLAFKIGLGIWLLKLSKPIGLWHNQKRLANALTLFVHNAIFHNKSDVFHQANVI